MSDMPGVGETINFVPSEGKWAGCPFTGVVVKSYGFAVSVQNVLNGDIAVLDRGVPFLRIAQ